MWGGLICVSYARLAFDFYVVFFFHPNFWVFFFFYSFCLVSLFSDCERGAIRVYESAITLIRIEALHGCNGNRQLCL